MSAAPPFDREAVIARLGPAAVEAARRNVAAAPPLKPWQIAQLRALVASTPRRRESPAA